MAHDFFLGSNCKALERARFLPGGVERSLSVAEVGIAKAMPE